MAWDSYHGQHKIKLVPEGANCALLDLRRKGSQWANIIGKVCRQSDGTYKHSVGASGRKYGEAIYGNFKTARAAIKDAIDGYGTYIGVHRTMSGARKRRRR